MKLFIISALVAVSAAARLEHLERGYLPPFGSGSGSNQLGSGSNTFGSASNQLGSGPSGFGSTGSQGPSAFHSGASSAAISNQYLPPNQAAFGQGPQRSQLQIPSTQYGAPHQSSFGQASSGFGPNSQGSHGFGHSNNGFGQHQGQSFGQSGHRQQGFGQQSPFGQTGQSSFGQSGQAGQFGSHSGTFGQSGAGLSQAQALSQFPLANRQYLTPKTQSQNNFQNIPQQSFDEQTGYHY